MKHRAITLDDIEELLTDINRKYLEESGTWAHGTSAPPYGCTIAPNKINVKLTNRVVQAKTNTRYVAENSLMSTMSFLIVQALIGLIIG